MQRQPRPKRVGIFLGRLQPQHAGHEALIRHIFRHNDEVVLCLGSAQGYAPDDPRSERNPLSINLRRRKLRAFLQALRPDQPYRLVTAEDIEPDSAWPAYLRRRCRLRPDDRNTLYFGEQIPAEYAAGLRAAGFRVICLRRRTFSYRHMRISSATEIRALDKRTA